MLKRCCLVDVAGMLRSFAYAAAIALRRRSPGDAARLDPWATQWLANVESYYLEAYLETASVTAILPRDPAILKLLVRTFMLDKAIYEIGYELANRPDWVGIPLQGAIALCELAKR